MWFHKHKHKEVVINLDQSTIDPQDPLPESNWFYRRLVLIGSLSVLLIQRSFELFYKSYNHWTDYLILAILILYTVAPSAEQVSKMFATVSLFGAGKTFSSAVTETATTTITKAGGDQTTTTTTKPAATPVTKIADIDENSDGELPPELRVKR